MGRLVQKVPKVELDADKSLIDLGSPILIKIATIFDEACVTAKKTGISPAEVLRPTRYFRTEVLDHTSMAHMLTMANITNLKSAHHKNCFEAMKILQLKLKKTHCLFRAIQRNTATGTSCSLFMPNGNAEPIFTQDLKFSESPMVINSFGKTELASTFNEISP